MRNREDILKDPKSFEALILEVLLDIRDQLSLEVHPVVHIEKNKEVKPKVKRTKKRKTTKKPE